MPSVCEVIMILDLKAVFSLNSIQIKNKIFRLGG